jgi:hypothetical protein
MGKESIVAGLEKSKGIVGQRSQGARALPPLDNQYDPRINFWTQLLPRIDWDEFIGELRVLRLATCLLERTHVVELTRLSNLLPKEI